MSGGTLFKSHNLYSQWAGRERMRNCSTTPPVSPSSTLLPRSASITQSVYRVDLAPWASALTTFASLNPNLPPAPRLSPHVVRSELRSIQRPRFDLECAKTLANHQVGRVAAERDRTVGWLVPGTTAAEIAGLLESYRQRHGRCADSALGKTGCYVGVL